MSDVIAIFDDVESLPRWWPSVYLSVRRLSDGEPNGVGRRSELHTTGWLPYTLSWISVLTEPVTDEGFAFRAEGDFNGTGRWIFKQAGPEVVLAFDWRISVNKPVVRRLSWLLRPLFAANHRWAMARGLESLRLELRRRQDAGAVDPGAVDRAAVDPAATIPPGPTFRRLRRR
ncbi:SRPBCC family protein [Nakamurella sp. GG22]